MADSFLRNVGSEYFLDVKFLPLTEVNHSATLIWVKTSLWSVISVHFFELFSVRPRKPIYIINKCYYTVVDIYNTL